MKKSKQLHLIFGVVFFCLSLGILMFAVSSGSKIKAYEIINTGDFRLTAESKWDETAKKIMLI